MVLFTPSLVICYHYICCIENYVTGDDFVDLDETDFKQLFPAISTIADSYFYGRLLEVFMIVQISALF